MFTDNDSSPQRVIIAMSGGVDSSVAAYLLKDQGYQVEGLFMRNWEDDDGTEYCTAMSDLMDAQSVCDSLAINLHTVNFAKEYWNNVFEHFLDEYRSGRTPNPDVLCNREIKFKAFLNHAYQLGANLIATGHYVQKQELGSATYLLKGKDVNKDQSYFLCEVNEACLRNTLFPLGELTKNEVRKIASQLNFPTHNKKDSTGICFIGERKFKDFLERYIPTKPGDIENIDGHLLGHHTGLMYYTLGQRQGLGIGGVKHFAEAAWYVLDKDLERNVLIVGQGNENSGLYSKKLIASKPDWINTDTPELPLRCNAKIRYRQGDQSCTVNAVSGNQIEVHFNDLQRAVTPGQYVVFYQGERCLGGSIIQQYFK